MEKALKALANRRRLAILRRLKKDKEVSVSDIARGIKLSVRSTSRHLRILVAADIVDGEQRSVQVFYHLATAQDPAVRYIIDLL